MLICVMHVTVCLLSVIGRLCSVIVALPGHLHIIIVIFD